jgi:hypothetical protein
MIINKKYLGQYSPLPQLGNYDFSEILNYVPVAQEIWLRPILGDAFMDELEYQVKNNQVSEENATLFIEGGLYQYLSYATCLEGLAFIWAHFSQTGISLGKSDNSDSITLKDLTYIESHLRRQVEFLKDALIKWLDSHCASYELYHSKSCGIGCCNSKGLNAPNPMFSIYTNPRKNTKLL